MSPRSSSTRTMQKVIYRHQKICIQQEHPTITATFVAESAYLGTVIENHSLRVKTISYKKNRLWKCRNS